MPEKKAILLRIPPDLWEQLNHWARDDLRSLNAQLEFILREALRKRRGGPPTVPEPDDLGPPAQTDSPSGPPSDDSPG